MFFKKCWVTKPTVRDSASEGCYRKWEEKWGDVENLT